MEGMSMLTLSAYGIKAKDVLIMYRQSRTDTRDFLARKAIKAVFDKNFYREQEALALSFQQYLSSKGAGDISDVFRFSWMKQSRRMITYRLTSTLIQTLPLRWQRMAEMHYASEDRQVKICNDLYLSVSTLNNWDMRLLNMLSDGRITGALIAEMFYPLIIAGLIEIFYHNKNKWYLLAYGMAGVFCCHVMSSSIVCFSVAAFALFMIRKFKDPGVLRAIGKAILLFAGLILGTAVLFVKYYFTDWGQDNLQWVDFTSTLWPRHRILDDVRWSYIITLLTLCIVALVIIVIRNRFELVKNTYIIPMMIIGAILFLMTTVAFPWKALSRIDAIGYYMNMLQDSYRFMTLAVCFLAFCLPGLLEAVVMSIEGRRSRESNTTVTSCIIVAVLCIASYVFSNYEFFGMTHQMLYYDAVIGDIESQVEDYLPKGTKSEWYESDTGYVSDEDAVASLAYEREGTYVYYSYTNSKEGAYVEFPKFYYDGYTAVDEMSEDLVVCKGDHNRTRVYLKVSDTPAVVRMWYHVPWYLTFFVAISLGMWIGSLMIVAARVYYRFDGVAAFYKKSGT